MQTPSQVYDNLNVLSNAVELVVMTIEKLNSDAVVMQVGGKSVDRQLLANAVAARLQRRLRRFS